MQHRPAAPGDDGLFAPLNDKNGLLKNIMGNQHLSTVLSPEASEQADLTSLVEAAQQGDPDGLALLLRSEYAGMLAVATRILGSHPDAEDACQDATITALGRIGDLRDPAKVRSWLHAIVRNNCRTMLSARKPVMSLDGVDLPASDLDDPIAGIERNAERDWVWHAVRRLSPAVQPVAMLRYFAERNSYDEIAALCGIPVGTVRSRLSEARRQLSDVLPRLQDDRHDDASALITERREEAAAILRAVPDGVSLRRGYDRWADDLTMFWPGGERTIGLSSVLDTMGRDYDDGVKYRLTEVVAGADMTIWENEFINPPEDPDHCPPAGTWLLRERGGLVREIRLIHAARPSRPAKRDRKFARSIELSDAN